MANQPHSPLSIAALTDQHSSYAPPRPPSDTTRSPPTTYTTQPSFRNSPLIGSPNDRISVSTAPNARSGEGRDFYKSQLPFLKRWVTQGGHPKRMSRHFNFWRLNDNQCIDNASLHPLDAFSEPPDENMAGDEVKFIVNDPII